MQLSKQMKRSLKENKKRQSEGPDGLPRQLSKLLKRLQSKLKQRNLGEKRKRDLLQRKTNASGEKKSVRNRRSKGKWSFKGKDKRKKNVVLSKRLGKSKSKDARLSKIKSEWKKRSDSGLLESRKPEKMNGRGVRSSEDRLR
jgi:hypothetical protein